MDAEAVFFGVISLDSPLERETFLQQHCGADGKKRRTLDALLVSHTTITDIPDAHEGVDDAEPLPPLHFLNPSLRPNSLGRLDQYEIVRVLQVGSPSLFLEGFDTRLKRIVAIKVLSPELCQSTEARQRFRREAAAAAAISSPHVVHVLGGAEQKQTPYLVMEIVPGKSLKQHLTEHGRCPLPEILRISREVAMGLAAIHGAGLLHRNLNPNNIILAGTDQQVRISGLGICRGIEESGGTPTSHLAAAPAFMAPEVAVGGQFSQRSDLFSLGAVIYALATGESPFEAGSAPATMRRVCKDSPPPLRSLNSGIPAWLEDVVMRLLAKNPDDRLQSGHDLVERFDAVTPPPVPQQSSFPAPIGPRWKRNRWYLRGRRVGICLLLLFSLWQTLRMLAPLGVGFGPVFGILLGVGQLEVSADDPNIVVVVEGGQERRPPVIGASTMPLPPNIEYSVTAYLDGEVIYRNKFTMERWGHVELNVRRDEALEATQAADPDRWAARWLLRRGGLVENYWHPDGQYRGSVQSMDQLPIERFFLEGVQLRNLTPAGFVVACSNLSRCSRLTAVRVRSSELDGESLRRVAKLNFLRELELTHVFDIKGSEWLALAALPELESLSLNYSPHAKEFCRAVGQFPRLRSLAIAACPVSDDMLVELRPIRNLETLKVYSLFLTDSAVDPLTELRSLKHLDLRTPNLTDEVWNKLVKLDRLEELQIGGYSEGKNTRVRFAEIQTPPQLSELTFVQAELNEEVLEKIAGLPQLTKLRFEDSKISENALEQLAGLQKLHTLEFVEMQMDHASLTSLQQKLPSCKITAVSQSRRLR